MDGDFYVDYSQLDSLQIAIIGDKFNDHLVVRGKAGTGKSLIALHKLGRVAPDKKAVLIVFTTSLKQYFKDGFKALGIDEKTGLTTMTGYHRRWTMCLWMSARISILPRYNSLLTMPRNIATSLVTVSSQSMVGVKEVFKRLKSLPRCWV